MKVGVRATTFILTVFTFEQRLSHFNTAKFHCQADRLTEWRATVTVWIQKMSAAWVTLIADHLTALPRIVDILALLTMT